MEIYRRILWIGASFTYLLFGGIVGLDGFSDDGAGGITTLVVLALCGDGAGHVAGGHHDACDDDCHE